MSSFSTAAMRASREDDMPTASGAAPGSDYAVTVVLSVTQSAVRIRRNAPAEVMASTIASSHCAPGETSRGAIQQRMPCASSYAHASSATVGSSDA
jgi:hypothetical protein